MYYFQFGELLKGHRKRQEVTQEELGQVLGKHRNTVGAWEAACGGLREGWC